MFSVGDMSGPQADQFNISLDSLINAVYLAEMSKVCPAKEIWIAVFVVPKSQC